MKWILSHIFSSGIRYSKSFVLSSLGRPCTELVMQTTNTLLAFFPAMAMHPGILKKAQGELDVVVGPDRLPDFSDQESLVYVNAIVKELLRWHPVVPLGIPHCTTEDDELDGYFVPAGTVIMTNVWCVWTARWMYQAVSIART